MSDLNIIEDQSFSSQDVELDGNGFVNCSFTKCNLVFRGTGGFGLDQKTLSQLNGVTMQFSDAAANTITALGHLYKLGGPFKQWVEHEMLAAGITPQPSGTKH
jgi:hypothetical protein